MIILRKHSRALSISLVVTASLVLVAQGPPPARNHTVTQSSGTVSLLPANTTPHGSNRVSITIEGGKRIIRANGIPKTRTGAFPNSGNPHRITQQTYRYEVPAQPVLSGGTTRLGMHNFGIAVDGVPFDPGAAEWFRGVRNSQWRYEPLSGAVRLGLDANHAHVQPSGAYHYHGFPTRLLKTLGLNRAKHSPLVGWAADGFPIYARFGYSNPRDAQSKILALRSSYRLRKGRRPAGGQNPGGRYDGTFVADYEYVPGLGMLDECNGRQTVTPDFPRGTYAYFLSDQWPVIPRCYKGTPSSSFTASRRRPPSGRHGPPPRHHFRGPPPRRGPPPFGRPPPR